MKNTLDLEKFFELNPNLVREQKETEIKKYITYKVIDCSVKNEKVKDYTDKIGQIINFPNFTCWPSGYRNDENRNIYLEKDLKKIE